MLAPRTSNYSAGRWLLPKFGQQRGWDLLTHLPSRRQRVVSFAPALQLSAVCWLAEKAQMESSTRRMTDAPPAGRACRVLVNQTLGEASECGPIWTSIGLVIFQILPNFRTPLMMVLAGRGYLVARLLKRGWAISVTNTEFEEHRPAKLLAKLQRVDLSAQGLLDSQPHVMSSQSGLTSVRNGYIFIESTT